MAYDEILVKRIRKVLSRVDGVSEKKMFGGVAFMYRGNMCCGVVGEKMMIRVGPKQYEELLARPHVRKMDFTGRPMKGFIYVEPSGLASEKELRDFVSLGVKYVQSLPAKDKK